MKLSIITINRNNAIGIKKTIDSVKAQTFNDFEYIVVDGASTDESVGAIEELASNYERELKWISEPDTGIYNAMNKGILMAQGEYLLFLNSGDYLMDKNTLNNLFAIDRDCDLLYGYVIEEKSNRTIYPPKEFSLRNLMRQNIPHQAEFIKRLLFNEMGRYDESYKILADFKFNLLLLLNDTVAIQVDECISIVEDDGISNSSSNCELMRMEGGRVISELVPKTISKDYLIWLNSKTYSHPAIIDIIESPLYLKFIKLIYKIKRALFRSNGK